MVVRYYTYWKQNTLSPKPQPQNGTLPQVNPSGTNRKLDGVEITAGKPEWSYRDGNNGKQT